MGLATLIFRLGTRHYVMVPPARENRKAGFFTVLVAAWQNRRNRPAGKGFWEGARRRYSEDEVTAAASVVGPILSVFAMAPVFGALFDPTHTTWVAQGTKMTPFELPFSITIDASAMQAVNPLMVMMLDPFLTLLIYPVTGRMAAH